MLVNFVCQKCYFCDNYKISIEALGKLCVYIIKNKTRWIYQNTSSKTRNMLISLVKSEHISYGEKILEEKIRRTQHKHPVR